eukprot:m.3882 g.3882  ORF g.3882 m.3882 type:complete len:228 (+) comp9913_c0_seq2:53-736(+)
MAGCSPPPLEPNQLTEGSESTKQQLSRQVRFGNVKILLFERTQGFQAVPREGGYSLGMKYEHFLEENVSADEWEARPGIKRRYPVTGQSKRRRLASEELKVIGVSNRMKALRAAGLDSWDSQEEVELEEIRRSRGECGCVCAECSVESACACIAGGVPCQVNDVDGDYPCSCTRESCGNGNGRQVFDSLAVEMARMKLLRGMEEMDRQQQKEEVQQEKKTPVQKTCF